MEHYHQLRALLAAAGRGPKPEAALPKGPYTAGSAATTSQPYMTFKDMADREIVLQKKPERIVILANETLSLFYQLGGRAVGRASSPGIPVSDAEKEAVDVGQITNVSLEKIVSLKPDLVIGQYYFNPELKDTLASAQIPFAPLKITSYEDVMRIGRLYGQILGKETEAEKALKETDARVQAVVGRAPDHPVTFAQVTIMPMGVYITKDGSTTTDIARRLKLKNAAEGMASGEWPDYAPYSLEKLVEADPDYLFIAVHGSEEFGRKKLKEDLESNPAWASIRAVKENRLVFLPSEFEKTPNLGIDSWFAYIAKLVYPDIYGR
ncbi:ABC transporter substrate-binding protein [Paenibacillus sp. P26]|nr:ABC transporter substrate-binding protein [Paenibacillus sp. P26]